MGSVEAQNSNRRTALRHAMRRAFVSLLALAVLGAVMVPALMAEGIETYAFEKVWWRTDLPVEHNQTNRTWVWGPEPISSLLLEPYDEGYASGIEGARWVQYFDKTRVEITRSDRDRDDDWYVTNGLLARELITGRMQLGEGNVFQYEPADVNVAGDGDDPDAPTYRSLNAVMDAGPLENGSTITQTLSRDGSIGANPDLANYGVTAEFRDDASNQTVASVFWEFMNSEGTIYDGFDYVDGRLFEDPFFATGVPITEPFWTTVRVGGDQREVLVQAFERRVLTFTPGNPEGWQVEAGNVGRHYYQWRYIGDGHQALTYSEITQTRDLSDNLIFMGEVSNNARAAYGEVEISLTITDDAGEPIETFVTYLDSAMIEPGERLPFQIWTEYPGDYSGFQVSLRSRPSHRAARPDVSIQSLNAEWESSSRYEIDGVIRNDEDRSVEYLQLVAALYDEEGRVVDYRWDMIEPIILEPGQEAHFDTFFFNPKRFADYEIFVLN